MENPARPQSLEDLERMDLEAEAAENAQRRTHLDKCMTVGQLRQQSKSDLAREIIALREHGEAVDMTSVIHQLAAAKASKVFRHREAFMLMTYVSEGGHLELRIWNSRDGVTPFQITIDNVKYTHAIGTMQGPFYDRPDECDAQWETRTVRAMMNAWARSLDRAVLLGKLDRVKAEAAKLDGEQAKSWNLHIGLRSLETGRYTDEA